MSPHTSFGRCCRSSAAPTPPRRRRAGIVGWLIPSAALILMPKCPLCVAMYVALFTGASISVASASHLRTGLVVGCSAVLLGLAVKALRRAGSTASYPQKSGSRFEGRIGPV